MTSPPYGAIAVVLPRDTVIFEPGLFRHRLARARERLRVLRRRQLADRLASDLSGVKVATYWPLGRDLCGTQPGLAEQAGGR